ncbi:MAG TPA: XdhC/CoxI family protein [bacterium]|nr:XdhC/CoxI family protein [bacterium]HXK93501.1 XdhC/CoxI family protein [bacterium]
MISIFRRVQELYEEGRPAALCTVVQSAGSTPQKPGARMIVYPDGSIEGTVGGGALEKRVIEEARKVIETGESHLIPIELREHQPHSVGGVCGGEMTVFVEKIGTWPRLLILGGGHVGQTLSRMAAELPLQIVVYDDREEYADPERFPPGVKTVCGPFENAMETLQPTSQDYIAIMTYKYTLDELLVKAAVNTPAKYIGMIGSEMKCRRVRDDLTDQGVPKEKLDRVHAPIGIEIGAHTPPEVAVSILGEIVQVMNGMKS